MVYSADDMVLPMRNAVCRRSRMGMRIAAKTRQKSCQTTRSTNLSYTSNSNAHALTCTILVRIQFFATAHGTIKFTRLYDRLSFKSYDLPRRHYDATIENLDLTAARLAASSSPCSAACLRTQDSIFSSSSSWPSCHCSDLSDS